MTLVQWFSLAIIGLLPVIGMAAYYIVRLPEQARIMLPQYALMAAQEVEHLHRNESNDAKRAYAVTSVIKYFRMYPFFLVPPRDRIEAAISTAVFQLPKTGK